MRLTLWELAKSIGISLKRGKNVCPICHHEALSIESYSCKCWWCGWKGNSVEFLIHVGGLSPQEAATHSGVGKEAKERDILYRQVLSWCQEYTEEAEKYLKARSINPDIYPHGYCPKGMLEKKLSRESLKRWGLASAKGYNLLEERVVFPVFDLNNRLVHFQGRSLDENNSLRWLSTTGSRPINDYAFNGQRWAEGGSIPLLFICEGITDTLSLATLGLAAIGSFGIYPPFEGWMGCLEAAEHIVLAYDSDRHPLGHPCAKQYISWVPVLERWSWVYRELQAPTYVLRLPPKYKDINEWIQTCGDVKMLERYLLEAPTVEEFALECSSVATQVRILSAGRQPKVYERWRKEQDWESIVKELAWQ